MGCQPVYCPSHRLSTAFREAKSHATVDLGGTNAYNCRSLFGRARRLVTSHSRTSTDEENVPTESAEAGPKPRLPGAYGHTQRS
jgi:hypothetical protein